MQWKRLAHSVILITLFLAGLAAGALLLPSAWAQSDGVLPASPDQTMVGQEVLALAKVITYQGRLLEPSTGRAKADGDYAMTFRIYGVAAGGTANWTEVQNVVQTGGSFSAQLGATTPFPGNLFDGRTLYLGVQVGSDAEATPRTRITPVAYALFADNADRLDFKDSTAFANASHAHDGGAITTGAVPEARIDGALARDGEVMNIVVTASGPGSGLSADDVDGYDGIDLYKGFEGVQYTATLAPGASITPVTFGWSPNQAMIWVARPVSINARLFLRTEVERDSDGNLAYWLTVTNVGTIATEFNLVYYGFYR